MIDDNKISVNEKIKKIEKICILYPRLLDIINEINICREDSKVANEAQSMLLMGESGAGKSTAIQQYVNRYPRVSTEDGMLIPVFMSALPSNATIKGVAQTLLTSLDAPRPEAGNTVQMTHRLVTLLKNCKVELIILDEFQHLLQKAAEKTVGAIADWIKMLINDSHIPIVLVGMPGSDALLKTSSQLDRRFGVVETFEPFSYENNPSELRKFLRALEKELPFEIVPGSIHLADPSCSMRIFLASAGSPAKITKIVREAAKSAVRCDAPCLTDELLSAAYEKFVFRKSNPQRNPWLLSLEDLEKLVNPMKKNGGTQ